MHPLSGSKRNIATSIAAVVLLLGSASVANTQTGERKVFAKESAPGVRVTLTAERATSDPFTAKVWLGGVVRRDDELIRLREVQVAPRMYFAWFPLTKSARAVRDFSVAGDPPRTSFRLFVTPSSGWTGVYRYRLRGDRFVRVNPGSGASGTTPAGCPSHEWRPYAGTPADLRDGQAPPQPGDRFFVGDTLRAGVWCHAPRPGRRYLVRICLIEPDRGRRCRAVTSLWTRDGVTRFKLRRAGRHVIRFERRPGGGLIARYPIVVEQAPR